MKLFQLLTLPSLVDLDRDDIEHAARTPNPVFLTFDGAARAALDDANGERFEYCKDFITGEDPEDDALIAAEYGQLTTLEWKQDAEDPARFTWNDSATNITYAIHEIEARQ